MNDPHPEVDEAGHAATAMDSTASAAKPSRKPALLREADLLERTLLTVPEAAFLLRASTRTVWRCLADAQSKFPKPRRVRGRTLLVTVEIVAFLQGRGGRTG